MFVIFYFSLFYALSILFSSVDVNFFLFIVILFGTRRYVYYFAPLLPRMICVPYEHLSTSYFNSLYSIDTDVGFDCWNIIGQHRVGQEDAGGVLPIQVRLGSAGSKIYLGLRA